MADRESLDYLYSLQRFGIKLGLDNIRRLLERIGTPQQGMQLVHVAGTNGKGSVCILLAALLEKAGHRTGLYTSPHLHAFNERIRVDRVPIGDDEIAALTTELRAACGGDIPATFFEFTTAMALTHFRNRQVAWGVLETGMGGRLDATNAVTPAVTVITSIAHDHAEHLGADLAQIAREKAGIIKPGVPIVSAAQTPEVAEVLGQCAAERHSQLYVSGRDFYVAESLEHRLDYRGISATCSGLDLNLEGAHQHENLALALAAFEVAGLWGKLDDDAMRSAVSGVRWPGRLEWWEAEPRVLLDGAHNVAGCRSLAAYLEAQGIAGVHLVFGTKADKSAAEMLALLLPYATSVSLLAPPVDAAAELEPLAAQVRAAGVPVRCCDGIATALQGGSVAGVAARVQVVAGSLFLVAAAREALEEMSQ